ncbi:MAG: hypothetical protein QOC61_1281, partial [Acidobacteriota bacterium]|nr:hypothetical protein [Acidobacteriota bacterium]
LPVKMHDPKPDHLSAARARQFDHL